MAQLMLVNPRKRRRKTTKRKSPSRRLATVKTTSVRRYRRNPSARPAKIMDTVQKGAVGAAGALAVDIAMQKLPIPANLQTGPISAVVKGGVGIGIGMLVAKFGKNKKLGAQLADGAVTVSLYNAGKAMVGPSLGLSDGELLGDDSLLYYDDNMSYFDDEAESDMGWTDATAVFEDDEDEVYQ